MNNIFLFYMRHFAVGLIRGYKHQFKKNIYLDF